VRDRTGAGIRTERIVLVPVVVGVMRDILPILVGGTVPKDVALADE
jgi:hypothetical protein